MTLAIKQMNANKTDIVTGCGTLKGKCTCKIGLLPCQIHGWGIPVLTLEPKRKAKR